MWLSKLNFLLLWLNTMAKNNLGKKGFMSLPSHMPSLREFMTGTWKQKLKQKPWRSSAHFCAPCGLFPLLSYAIQDHLHRGSNAHGELDNALQTCLQANLQGQLISVKISSSQIHLGLYQEDKHQTGWWHFRHKFFILEEWVLRSFPEVNASRF